MHSTAAVKLDMLMLPPTATYGHRLPGIHDNLFSVATAVDAGLTAHFYPTHCTFTKDNIEVLRGWRDMTTKLWRIDINPRPQGSQATASVPVHYINSIYDCENNEQLIKYYHAAAFSPVTSTWIKAISKGYFRGWPGLTTALVHRYIKNEVATVMGHKNQIRQGTQSTKITTLNK